MRIIREGTDDASQEKGQSCLFVLERYRERSRLNPNSRDACLSGSNLVTCWLCHYLKEKVWLKIVDTVFKI